MNKKKIAFIICVNNQLYFEECRRYIELLEVPIGYEIEIITVTDAKSMTSGYNCGANRTDARYKVYMHQDVFIINRFFINDIVDIFESDPKIGMIGMIGYPVVSDKGMMWTEACYGSPLYGMKEYSESCVNEYRYTIRDGYADVSMVDGLMMITAYDIPWDEQELKDWDYYDAFQSLKYLLSGYRVVTPIQKIPWVIHDDGSILSMKNYGKYSRKFIQKYGRYMGKKTEEILCQNRNEKRLLEYNFEQNDCKLKKKDVLAIILTDTQLHLGNKLKECLEKICGLDDEKIIQLEMTDIDFETGEIYLNDKRKDYCSNFLNQVLSKKLEKDHFLLMDARYFPMSNCVQEMIRAVETGIDAVIPKRICFPDLVETSYDEVQEFVDRLEKNDEGVWENELKWGCIMFSNNFVKKNGGFISNAVMPEYIIKKYCERGKKRGAKFATINDSYVMNSGISNNWELLLSEKEATYSC